MTEPSLSRADFPYLTSIDTRWMDDDAYGHVNNVVYYSFFDTAVNRRMIEAGVLDRDAGSVVALVAETRCRFFKSLSFPDRIEVGLRATRLGTSSVTYETAIFRAGESDPAALGLFVHVFVDRSTRKPVPIPDAARRSLAELAAG